MAFDLDQYMRGRAALVERKLAQYVRATEGPATRLFEAMRYSLLAGGKRLRPIIALAACEAVGGSHEDSMAYACALEMIHTYSLIHDDLPCMDDDDLRRGRPTNHKVYGEALATLAGDGLLTDAFKVCAQGMSARISTAVALRVIAELAEAAGSAGMVAGQVIDLMGEGKDLSLQELEFLHGKKTGALFVAAVSGGALLGGANEAQLKSLLEYAAAIGLAFQVADDLLDVEASSDHVGKRTHKDAARGKATYPALMGVAASHALARELVSRAHQALASFDESAQPLRALATYAVERRQ